MAILNQTSVEDEAMSIIGLHPLALQEFKYRVFEALRLPLVDPSFVLVRSVVVLSVLTKTRLYLAL